MTNKTKQTKCQDFSQTKPINRKKHEVALVIPFVLGVSGLCTVAEQVVAWAVMYPIRLSDKNNF